MTADAQHPEDQTVIATLQSLILAFVLAMTFRGFITEGFVIPTGSMAPTLMGRHFLAESPQTGATFRIGADSTRNSAAKFDTAADPMLGPNYSVNAGTRNVRMGDRILVLKCLYPFNEPDRWDVVVFKNPTDPNGEAGNYIKRLLGAPNESILLIDGDVFYAPASSADELTTYTVARKPEHVQRAVWRAVADSDLIPLDPSRLMNPSGGPAARRLPTWIGDGWDTGSRTFTAVGAEPSVLRWNGRERPINDWASYNQRGRAVVRPVSDIRVRAAIRPAQDGLVSTFEITARNTLYQYVIGNGRATVRMRHADETTPWIEDSVAIDTFPADEVINVEFWHADQAMSLYINDVRTAYLEYDWKPLERLRLSRDELSAGYDRLINRNALPPEIQWRFEGSPVEMHRVRLDRDIHYRKDIYSGRGRNNPSRPEYEELLTEQTPAFGTHPDKPAVLGPDHYFMCGDNSPASLDSRLWGAPHPLIAEQIDPAPFVVNRKLLLGKAWVVYFPAPYSLRDGGKAFIPDFGRLRFIR